MAISTHLLASIFGILGNIISFCVFLAPVPTFYRIFKKKSTEGFQAVPYSVALFSCMLLLFYGFLKTENGMMIITINSIGCAIETIYIVIFLCYATRESLVSTVKLLVVFNVASFAVIVLTTLFATQAGSERRVSIVGWICAVFSVCVFAAPLSIMRLVIKTKSVEYMPFFLSFFLTLCAVMWFFYGLLIKDYYVATPNVLGFIFGIAQMILYMIYKDYKQQAIKPVAQPEAEPAAQSVVDLGAILEIRRMDLGMLLQIEDKGRVELGVILEMQEKSVAGDEDGDEKQEEVANVSLEVDGEKTIIPSVD